MVKTVMWPDLGENAVYIERFKSEYKKKGLVRVGIGVQPCRAVLRERASAVDQTGG